MRFPDDPHPGQSGDQRTHHRCPGRCGRAVPNHLYACGPCWRKLPGQLQREIRATVGDPVLSPPAPAHSPLPRRFTPHCLAGPDTVGRHHVHPTGG